MFVLFKLNREQVQQVIVIMKEWTIINSLLMNHKHIKIIIYLAFTGKCIEKMHCL